MKLLLNKEIPLTSNLETKLDWVWVNNGHVLAQKINLDRENLMVDTMWWLEQNSEFDSQRLSVILEDDCIKLIYE